MAFTSAMSQGLVVGGQIVGTPAPGSYFHPKSILLKPGFQFTSSTGSNLHLYISGCVPLAATPSNSYNYFITYSPRKSGIINPAADSTSVCNVMQTIQYLDGLGRPSQTIQVKGSSDAARDIIQPIVFDQYGKESVKYLPYVTSTGVAGSYRETAIADQQMFYHPEGTSLTVMQLADGIPHIPTPYAVKVFEHSPLNRVVEQGAPGIPWQPFSNMVVGSGHTAKFEYATNDVSSTFNSTLGSSTPNNGCRVVALYSVSYNGSTPELYRQNNSSYYSPGQLYLTVSKDENWQVSDGCLNTIEEYKDKYGRVILSRTYNKSVEAGTFIIQMLSTYYVYDNMGNLCFVLSPGSSPDANASISQSNLDKFCYQYRYDSQNRMVEKKLPGKDWEFIVYNRRDQVVYTQDAVQKINHQWSWIKYDVLGRVILTGVENNNFMDRQTVLNYFNALEDNSLWEERTDSRADGYTIRSHPQAGNENTNIKILTAKYYDDYSFLSNSSINPNNTFFQQPENSQSSYVRGFLTATRVNILNTDDYLLTVNYYDDEGRVIQSRSQNHLQGTDVIDNSYSFTDELLTTKRTHKSNTTQANMVTIGVAYDYDHIGRKIESRQSINNTITPTIISHLDYNPIGQLINKQIGNNLQEISYGYNERGWMRSATTSGNLFNMELKYDHPDAGIVPNYNGNVSQMNYLTTHTVSKGNKSFSYIYDKLNRLTGALSTGSQLDESLTFDVMGNILSLNRGGNGASSLAYVYTGNQVATVTKNGNAYRSYQYDDNGNAKSDGMSKRIAYNIFNLPQNVTLTSTGEVISNYTYDATGNKLRNTGTDGKWDYISGIVYHNNVIDFIDNEEGRVKYDNNSSTYIYEYHLKDHLGNSRVSIERYNSAARVIQEDEYYSFGLRVPGYDNGNNNNRNLYNGKEIQKDLENQYDYGARFYDPVIARWTSVDPLAEKMRRFSSYNYGFNNPVRFIDPDGRSPLDDIFSKTGHFIRHVDNGSNNIYIEQSPGKFSLISNFQVNSNKAFLIGPDRNESNRNVINTIMNHFAKQMGTSVAINPYGALNAGELAHFSPNSNKIFLTPEDDGRLSTLFNDSYSLKSVISHELNHKNDDQEGIATTYLSHSKVYFDQMVNDSNFAKAPFDFQKGQVGSFASYIYSAMYNNQEAGASKLIKQFNSAHINGWTIGTELKNNSGWSIYHNGSIMGYSPLQKSPY